MKKLLILSSLILVIGLFSCSKDDITTQNENSPAVAQADLKAGNGNNGCTPQVIDYDYYEYVPGGVPFYLFCTNATLVPVQTTLHFYGQSVVAASCRTNDNGTAEESTILMELPDGPTYTLEAVTDYHNHFYSPTAGYFGPQGATIFQATYSCTITNNVTGETFAVSLTSRYVENANGDPVVEIYELTCE